MSHVTFTHIKMIIEMTDLFIGLYCEFVRKKDPESSDAEILQILNVCVDASLCMCGCQCAC